MKTNLLLLDTFRNMENLIDSAFSLSNQLKRKLKIAYVFDFTWVGTSEFVGVDPVAIPPDANFQLAESQFRKSFEQAEPKIRAVADKYLKSHPESISYEIEVVESNRYLLINEVVEKEKDVLLLMSNYNSYSGGMSGMDSFPNVLDDLPCPVLIIQDDVKSLVLTNYLYATDFHREDLEALASLSDMMEFVDGKKLTVFHSVEHETFESHLEWTGFQLMVKERVRGFNLNFGLAKAKDVRKGLKTFIEDEDPDVVVVLKEKKGFFSALFSESETQYLVTHFNKPVLIYHEQNMSKQSEAHP